MSRAYYNEYDKYCAGWLRNLSAAGAAISVPNAATVPVEFELQFDSETRNCIVAWRRLDRLGVKFK